MIRRIQYEDVKVCIEIIHESFATVAKDFHLTKENCPGHTSFMPVEKLYNQYEEGRLMFVYEKDDKLIGYFSINKQNENSYELDNLAVLPNYRNLGIGKEMVEYAKNIVMELGGNKMTIGIIDENEILKKWYSRLGFIHKGTRKIDFLPFTVGYMEMNL